MAPRKKTAKTEEAAEMPGMMAMSVMNPLTAKAWTDLMAHSTRVMQEAVQAQIDFQQEVMSAKTPADLWQIQTQFASSAAKRYMDETARLSEVMMGLSTSMVDEVTATRRSKYDDIPV